ncbi:hypothetical protein [Hymenobacter sp. BT559]|uniref:hypothetical protein n=1 Tax=Hymenobacter sp. BT559 TaxID=2795729 RepID=UPI0018EDBF26|nr:hypothetical protein [Hymenobacter sp. BT559]MBJ6145933.1 hypothetical protein [Hymenobacter sp. BT559]
MKTHLPPRAHWSTPAVWRTSATSAPIWGTVSVSQLPARALPQPLPGCQLQVLLRI